MGRDLPSPLSRQKGWGGTCPPRCRVKKDGEGPALPVSRQKWRGGTCLPIVASKRDGEGPALPVDSCRVESGGEGMNPPRSLPRSIRNKKRKEKKAGAPFAPAALHPPRTLPKTGGRDRIPPRGRLCRCGCGGGGGWWWSESENTYNYNNEIIIIMKLIVIIVVIIRKQASLARGFAMGLILS